MATARPLPPSPAGPCGSGGNGVIHPPDCLADFFLRRAQGRTDFQVITLGERGARFLQGDVGVSGGGTRGRKIPGGNLRGLGSLQPLVELLKCSGRRGDGCFAFAAAAGLAVGSLPGRLVRPLARIDRARERQPVIALVDRLIRGLQGAHGCRKGLSGVLIRAGRARGVDRALCRVEFLLWRFGAGGAQEERAHQAGQATHQSGSIAGMVYDEDGCGARSSA